MNPGDSIDYDGQKITYPDIKAIVWAGGNPFHHHQDLKRLIKAWAKPELIIVNEIFWNTHARYADIVFPATTALERNDLGISSVDHWIAPSVQAVSPYGQARDDYSIFSGLAKRLGFEEEFTEGRNAQEWVEYLYNETVQSAKEVGIVLPEFDDFWDGQGFSVEEQIPAQKMIYEKFREDPSENPLPLTKSGKIEIFSAIIDGFGYPDCKGHPMWFPKQEWLGSDLAGTFPFHLISNQPKTRLHSQLDHGVTSQKDKD